MVDISQKTRIEASNYHIDPQIKLQIVNEKRVMDILRDYESLLRNSV
jgi:hypothetical protein